MMQLAQMLAEQYEAGWEKLNDNPSRVYFPNFGTGDNALKSGIDIDRVAFKIPGTNFEIYWYGLTIAVGIILAMIYGFRKMKKAGIDPDRATDAVIGGFFGAIVGARLYYIMFSDSTPFSKFFDFREGGLAIYGGLIGAIVVGGIIVKLRKLRLTAMLDVVAPCFFIGQCLGRWGNFFNQEAFGTNTELPWGMLSKTTATYIKNHITDGSVDPTMPIHPCFLYESLWCLLGFIILHAYFKHRKFDGEVFLCYTAWYGLGRFFIEGLRTDSLYIGSVRVSQLLAAACFVVSVIAIIVVRVRIAKNKDYVFFKDTELSKAQIAHYEQLKKFEKDKKELRKKISEAKGKGEDTEELEKELENRFGPEARKDIDRVIADAEKADEEARKARLEARRKAAEAKAEDAEDAEEEVSEKAEEVKEEVSEKAEKIKEEAAEKAEEAEEEVSEKIEEAKPQAKGGSKKNRKKNKKQAQKTESKAEEVNAEVSEEAEKAEAEVSEAAGEAKAEVSEVAGEAEAEVSEVAVKAEEKVSEVAEEAEAEVSEVADKAEEEVSETAEEVKKEVSEAAEEVKKEVSEVAEEVKKEVSEVAGEAKEEVSEKAEEVKKEAPKAKAQGGAKQNGQNRGGQGNRNSQNRNQNRKKNNRSRNKNRNGGKQGGNNKR